MNTNLEIIKSNISTKSIFDNLDISDQTRIDYQYRINKFVEFANECGLNRNSFLDFKKWLSSRNDYSASTKNKYLATARIFLKELNRLGYLPVDITQNIKSFNQDKKHKKDGLNDREIIMLIESLKKIPPTSKSTRLKAIVSLLTLQGLRQIEISRLDVKDLDLVSKVVFVQGKGRDDKEIVNLHPETVKSLIEYLRVNKIADGALFISGSNNSKNHRLTTRSIRAIVQKNLKSLEIDRTVHGFRHYFTTKLIESYKGDLLEVARYTRHKNLEMLQVYNDRIRQKEDLPRFYQAFSNLNF